MLELWKPGQSGAAVMTRREVRAYDRWAIETMRIPGIVLMENAGRGCAECLLERLGGLRRASVVMVCGSGNNGGDGYVIARHLANAGHDCTVILCADRERIDGDARVHLEGIERMGLRIVYREPGGISTAEQIRERGAQADWIVDAYLGTGLQGALNDTGQAIVEAMNSCGRAVLAVDIPSGMDCDLGTAEGGCVKAALTVTFAAAKKGFVAHPDSGRFTGDVYVASIGIDARRYPGS